MTTRPEPASPPAAAPVGAPEALVGKRVHKYEIVRVLGRGGMGTVYEAVNTTIGKRVAMKFIDADTVRNADAVARFQREAQAASAVESAHIVDIFDSGISEEGQPYIVMELLRGEDLGHRIKRCGRLDLPEAVHITAQILRGLNRAHKAGIVHRDLKPDNIFLVDRDDDPNFAKILDFGISKVRRRGDMPVNTLTRQGTVLGTPFYMSPEQAQAQPDVDARSDLWSVGAILFECLTGRPPYTGATYEQVIVNICMNDAEDVRLYNPTVPDLCAQIIARALARDRDERFDDAREFLDALRAGGLAPGRGIGIEDSFRGVSTSDPALSPVSSGSTPSSLRSSSRRRPLRGDEGAFDATVKFQSTPPPKPRSEALAAHRRAAERRQRMMTLGVAVSALLVGGLGAYVFTRNRAHPADADPPPVPAESAQLPPSVQTIPGPPASTPLTPSAQIAPEPTAAASSEPAAAPSSSAKTPKSAHPVVTTQVPVLPGSMKTPPGPSATVAPAGSGVAPGLTIHRD